MTTKHGGSPLSGLVLPPGMDALRPVSDNSPILEPEMVLAARKDAAERRERALHFERRRLALELLSVTCTATDDDAEAVKSALALADELINQTGGVV